MSQICQEFDPSAKPQCSGLVTDTVTVGTCGSLNSLVSQKWGRQNVKYDACCHPGLPPSKRPQCLGPCLRQGGLSPPPSLEGRGEEAMRWGEDSFFHHQKGFLDFLPLSVALAPV